MRQFWRAAATPIVLLLLLALLVLGFWWGWKNVVRPPVGRLPIPCVTQNVGKALKSSSVTVRVYNGGHTVGLAGDVADALKKKGFKVTTIANTDEPVAGTIVRGGKQTNPEVKLVAQQLKATTAQGDDRIDGTVDVLVGTKFGGLNPKGATTLAVPGGTVCLPSSSATPTPSSKPSAAPKAKATSPAAKPNR